MRSPALVLCAALSLAACASTHDHAASTPSPTSTASTPAIAPSHASAQPSVMPLPRLLTCAETTVVRPSRYVFACGDGNVYVQHVRWTSWTASAAAATATWVQNDCRPYCAAGHFHSYRAQLRFDRVKRTDKGPLFSRWTARFPGRTPTGQRVESDPDFLPTSLTILS